MQGDNLGGPAALLGGVLTIGGMGVNAVKDVYQKEISKNSKDYLKYNTQSNNKIKELEDKNTSLENRLNKLEVLSSSIVLDVISNTTLEYSFFLNDSCNSISSFKVETINRLKQAYSLS